MITETPDLRDITSGPGEPTPYKDVPLLHGHIAQGHDPAGMRVLNVGETWMGPPPGLRAALRAVPLWTHGYALSPYGWPRLREALRDYITISHRLSGHALGAAYDVTVSQGSTRSSMPDFGRLLIEESAGRPGRLGRLRPSAGSGHRPIAVTSEPGWDYAGALAPVGFEMRTFPVLRSRNYQPDIDDVTEALHRARRDTTGAVLLVLNPQHNPTGAHWTPATVGDMIRAALGVRAALMIDDAYYGVHNPDVTPTSALALLLDELNGVAPDEHPRWLGLRSLGKQFRCNGWGIGALSGAPDTLRDLAVRLTQRTYVTAGPLQHAMAEWLRDPRAAAFLEYQNHQYAARRATIERLLADDLGYPPDAYSVGECAAYMLMQVPQWVPAAEDYRSLVLDRTDVMLGESHMSSPGDRLANQHGLVRLFLGSPEITGALKAMSAAGLTWRPSWR
ncbi:aminotransferase class I/II-fold pyridoxal phosphate-dependent enzyme [Streptomyces niveus]|uniref:aminotransferase class I/II-fold pyridoxal phosphate-dependent enzyme n=1 Tax=Streptomyces niveus TaxID=193462 RepID=UPI003414AEDD